LKKKKKSQTGNSGTGSATNVERKGEEKGFLQKGLPAGNGSNQKKGPKDRRRAPQDPLQKGLPSPTGKKQAWRGEAVTGGNIAMRGGKVQHKKKRT